MDKKISREDANAYMAKQEITEIKFVNEPVTLDGSDLSKRLIYFLKEAYGKETIEKIVMENTKAGKKIQKANEEYRRVSSGKRKTTIAPKR